MAYSLKDLHDSGLISGGERVITWTVQRLSVSDHELLLGCLQELHGMSNAASLQVWLLEKALPRLVPADWYSYNEADLREPALIALARPVDEAPLRLGQRWAALAHEHPLVQPGASGNQVAVQKTSDFVTPRGWHQLALYQDVYRELKVEFQISVAVKVRSDHVTALALSRQKRDFSERDRSLLEAFRPHLALAFRNVIAQQEAMQAVAEITAELQRLGNYSMETDSVGRVLRSSPEARQLLQTYFGPHAPTRLPEEVRQWLKACTARVPSLEPPVALYRESTAGRLTIRRLPAPADHGHTLILSELTGPDWRAILAPLGFSQREVEVARWLIEGKTNLEIGAILAISSRTVQKHLERIFARLGVETRTAPSTRMQEAARQR